MMIKTKAEYIDQPENEATLQEQTYKYEDFVFDAFSVVSYSKFTDNLTTIDLSSGLMISITMTMDELEDKLFKAGVQYL